MAFMSLEKNFFEKKNKYYMIFAFFSLSNFCLFSIMSGHIKHYRCSTKVQSNIFWGTKNGFKTSKAFSGKF